MLRKVLLLCGPCPAPAWQAHELHSPGPGEVRSAPLSTTHQGSTLSKRIPATENHQDLATVSGFVHAIASYLYGIAILTVRYLYFILLYFNYLLQPLRCPESPEGDGRGTRVKLGTKTGHCKPRSAPPSFLAPSPSPWKLPKSRSS